MSYIEQLKRQVEKIVDVIMTAKVLQLELVKIIDILKGNVLNPTIMANKILLKTIEITISNCFIYMPEVIRLFFKPFLLFFIKLY